MNRRSFLGSILAAAAAPAIVRADSLMRIVPREMTLMTGDYVLDARGSDSLLYEVGYFTPVLAFDGMESVLPGRYERIGSVIHFRVPIPVIGRSFDGVGKNLPDRIVLNTRGVTHD